MPENNSSESFRPLLFLAQLKNVCPKVLHTITFKFPTNLTINPNKSYRFKDLQRVALYILVNLTVSGKSLAVRLVIDQSRNIKSLTINGQSIQDNKTYTIATIDYLANTGEYGLDKYITHSDSPEYIRDYFGEYIKHLSEENDRSITASTDGRVKAD